MANKRRLTRREFLKFASVNLVGLACPKLGLDLFDGSTWPSLGMDQIPEDILNILQRVPQTRIDPHGYLLIQEPNGKYTVQAPLATTKWNQDNSSSGDKLVSNLSWGIVLHWYGDKDNFDRSVKGYIRGFDSLREVDGEMLRTSAHFLVGDRKPLIGDSGSDNHICFLQTQAPSKDGTPFVASHLRPINYQAHQERKQYFVRAQYQLGYNDPLAYSLLQDIYDGPRIDPNRRTIAIEITGYNFEKPDGYPSQQKIANVVSLVWALMRRYRIPANCLLGHHEIQLSKADPGKKFMTLIRYLIAVKALVDHDELMKQLVFGQYFGVKNNYQLAVHKYFQLVRDYLVLVSTPRTAYEWEVESKYWFISDAITNEKDVLKASGDFHPPFRGEIYTQGSQFLQPENHEGVDLCNQWTNHGNLLSDISRVHLLSDGECLYIGESDHCRRGQAAIFRHRQLDGAEILSIYSHLQAINNIRAGVKYPSGYIIGSLDHPVNNDNNFLHLSLAYGASWDIGLKNGPEIPLNAGKNWITRRYLDPMAYMAGQQQRFPEINSPINSKI